MTKVLSRILGRDSPKEEPLKNDSEPPIKLTAADYLAMNRVPPNAIPIKRDEIGGLLHYSGKSEVSDEGKQEARQEAQKENTQLVSELNKGDQDILAKKPIIASEPIFQQIWRTGKPIKHPKGGVDENFDWLDAQMKENATE
jgi:hypothetical protein